jgi:ribosomal-protein-alanine N-acetyltransferase
MTVPELLTNRTLLRPYTPDDAIAMHSAIYGDADVMRFLPGNAPVSIERSERSINYFINHWHEHGYGAWAVIHRADNVLIGQCGLNRLQDGAVEVFYALAKAYWGQGLATEAARVAVDYGFEVIKLPQIIALAYPDNQASRHVIEKLGMRYQGNTDRYYNINFAHYTLDADDYAAKS